MPLTTLPSRASTKPSVDEFENLIDAITAHHIAQVAAAQRGIAPRPYSLSEGLGDDNPDLTKLPTEAQEAFETSKNENEEKVKKNQAKTAELAEKRYSGEGTENWFEAEINAQADRNIEEFARSQRALAAKLKNIGTQNPESKALILQGYNCVSKFFTDLWNGVLKFFNDLIQHLVDLWNKVKAWFEDTWKSVVDWWRVLFA